LFTSFSGYWFINNPIMIRQTAGINKDATNVSRVNPTLDFVQITLVIMVIAASIVMPPRRGAMLVAPIQTRSVASTINWATERGAKVINAGPVRGSILISGSRDALVWPSIKDGYLLIGVPAPWCGARSDGERNV
jgi:hypothetical protein